ncbi:small ribosomal subunit protein bS6m-like [Saccoglossus kowalevskii]|uniref:Small ribosomal subunit protein bS6m n=1 Tax=Saccoglossus kowalevskii TaxID=10224 RepID=A0ABM0GIM9_SACKO|nr:PREDICTED: 28S ribosomal protein S6, mitochondrial-like [Saccoglossus kowalevskii]
MPRYEMALIFRALNRSETISAMKRVGESVIERGGQIRTIENLGEKDLPFKMVAHSQGYRRGRYIVMEFDGKPSIVSSMVEYLRRDVDVIRPAITKLRPFLNKTMECDGPKKIAPPRSLSDTM